MGCCDASGAMRARAVCDTLGIPHYTWNAREAFAEEVAPMLASNSPYELGMSFHFGFLIRRLTGDTI